MLSTPELPWERALAKPLETVPWLALLVLNAAELDPVTTRTVDELLTAAGGVAVPALDASPEEHALRCQTIDVPAGLFAAVVPRSGELPLLAHTRDLSGSDSGQFGVVVANRLPAASVEGVRGVAHLVSLEGHESRLDLDALPSGTTSGAAGVAGELELHRDARHCRRRELQGPGPGPDEGAGGRAAGPGAGTAVRRAGAEREVRPAPAGRRPARRWLRPRQLPPPDRARTRSPGTAAPSPRTRRRRSPGARSRPHRQRSSTTRRPGSSTSRSRRAWEIGRALALADRSFAAELVQFRRGAHRLVDGLVAALQSRHVKTSDADLATITQSGLIEQHFLERLQADLAGNVGTVASGQAAGGTPPAGGSDLPDDPVAAVKKVLERDDVQALVADDLKPIGKWLESLTRFNRVPFAYLVAHPQLLPVESARFFAVDQNWIGALADGALSVGIESRRDTWFQQVVQTVVPDAARVVEQHDDAVAAQPAGMLLRSALVSGWPGLTVNASAGGTSLDLLRSDLLAPSVLLCLFSGVPDTVSVVAPHQALHFSLSDGVVQPRQRTAPIGKPVGTPVAVDASLYRKGPAHVLDIAGLASKLGATASADFALQMLYAPEEVTFAR